MEQDILKILSDIQKKNYDIQDYDVKTDMFLQ